MGPNEPPGYAQQPGYAHQPGPAPQPGYPANPGYPPHPGYGPPMGDAAGFATPPSGKGKKGLIFGLVGVGVVLLALIAVVAIRLTRDPKYVMTTPPKAGGWVLVSKNASALGNSQADTRG